MNFNVQLAQVTPGTVSSQTAYIAAYRTEVTRIVVCNARASATTYSIYHDDDGGTFSTATALVLSKAIAANTTETIEANSPGSGLGMRVGGEIGVQAGTVDALTFSLYGLIQVAR